MGPLRPEVGPFRLELVQEWIVQVSKELTDHPPLCYDNGEYIIASDGGAVHPSDPDLRLPAWAVAWRTSESHDHSVARVMPASENTVNSSELIAAAVALASVSASRPIFMHGSRIRIVSDHKLLVGPARQVVATSGKAGLWSLFNEHSDFSDVQISWVPSHGKRDKQGAIIPAEWRRLNDSADRAVGRVLAVVDRGHSAWRHALWVQRDQAVRILTLKSLVFRKGYDLLVGFMTNPCWFVVMGDEDPLNGAILSSFHTPGRRS